MSLPRLFLGLLLIPQSGSKDQPPITFRVEVSYIEVDAIVTDSQGRFVSGLTQNDFEVVEKGKPQAIASFSVVDLPLEKAATDFGEPAPLSDVATNQGPVATRLYVLLLDDLHTAALRSVYVKNAARRFIEQSLSDTDLAAVVLTSGRSDAAQGFTAKRGLLRAAVDKFIGKKIPSTTAVLATPESEGSDIREEERGSEALAAMRSLRGIAESLARVRGRRKAIVYVSEGIDFDVEDPMKKRFANAIREEMKAATGTANRANVSFYSLDPRGLDLESDLAAITTYRPDPESTLGIRSVRDELRRAHASLRSLAAETGGFAVLNQNDLREGLSRIVTDNSQYYLLGYYPANEKRDGKYRTIEVRVKRPGLIVRARKGYVAPRGENEKAAEVPADVAAPLVDVLRSPVPVAGVPLRAVAVPVRSTGKLSRVLVAIEMDIRDFRFTEREGKLHDAVQLAVVATDRRGKVAASKGRTANLAVPKDAHQRLTEAGFRTLSVLELEPGQYQIGVAAREEGAGLTGSVFCDLEVPKPDDAVLITGVALSSAREAAAPVMAAPEDRAGLLVVPTTRREFRRGDELILAADVIVAAKGTTVDVSTVIARASDRSVVLQSVEERSGADLASGESFIHHVKIPLASIEAGDYVLELKAVDRSRRKEATHVIPFKVVDLSPP